LAARSSVDFPDPDNPMRTEISPRSTLSEAFATPTPRRFRGDLGARAAGIQRRERLLDGYRACAAPALAQNRISTARNASAALMARALCRPGG